MDKLIILIGADKMKVLKEAFEHPEKTEKNTHTLFLKDAKELSGALSPKKLEMLRRLIDCESEGKTVGELAQELGRKQEAISRDASFLATQQLVKKVKKKREVYLKAPFKTIEIVFSSA